MVIGNDALKVTLKSAGAEMTSINYRGIEYLWNGDKKYWGRHAPILFPIVGRLKDNKTVIEGKEYEMSQHGFARDCDFQLNLATSTMACYRLKYNEETLKKYPYRFELSITYEVMENSVKVTYQVKNKDDKTMFFSIGGHPAFRWPLLESEKFEDYVIEFSEKETANRISVEDGYVYETEDLLLKDEDTISLSKKVFDIDTFIFHHLNSKSVTFKSKKSEKAVILHFEGFPYLGIWSRKDEAEFLCLEPWFGIADRKETNGIFEEKPGINRLEPKASFECSYKIELQ
ncbi:MAG: aldose 1-epimerase family protein [Clostridia bacterium]|nr:aldose 1-epimerase family protein [Clostridia bacterium]